ncbi:MAG: hypothetical protein QT11_C0001G0287 [archaeon GW2011_AR20]|nr:MAG: hypothetical protein QT11_C0001G0287 [archaeon GW2011_AR20]
MVLSFEISHPMKRRCLICNETKLIEVNKKPICKECLIKRREKKVYYWKLILIILLILVLVLIIEL